MTGHGLLRVRPHQRVALTNTFTKSIADRLPSALIVGGFLAFMGFVLGPIFPAIEESIAELVGLMPPELLRLVGNADMSTPAGWLSGEMYSIMAPAAIITVALVSGAKAFAGEMEAGSMGLLLVNPVSRTRVGVDKAAAMLIHVALASLLSGLGVWLGVVAAGLPVEPSGIAAITLNLALLGAAAGGLAVLIAVVTGRRLLAMLATAGAAAVAWIWASFLPLAPAVEGLAVLSPWFHYNAADPLSRGVDPVSAAVLAGLTAVALAAGIAAFRRRDLAA